MEREKESKRDELEGEGGKGQKEERGKKRVVAEEREEAQERDSCGGGGKEAESLGGSQAALSVSVAAQSGLLSPWP